MTSKNEHTDVTGEVEAQIQAIRITIGAQWSEILSATLLAVVAIGTAWSGFQSARWGGNQSIMFTRASSLRVESTRASMLGGQLVTLDAILFEGWVDAYVAENENVMDFYEDRFRDEFIPAFDAWIAIDPVNNPDAPSGPFLMEEYQIASLQEAIQLEEEASALFAAGEIANQTSDDYAFSTVLLATVLFFAGIATRFDWQPIRWVMLAIGIGLLAFGVYTLLSLPIA